MTRGASIRPGSLCHILHERTSAEPLHWWQLFRRCPYPDSPRVRGRVRNSIRLLTAYGYLEQRGRAYARTPAGEALLGQLGAA